MEFFSFVFPLGTDISLWRAVEAASAFAFAAAIATSKKLFSKMFKNEKEETTKQSKTLSSIQKVKSGSRAQDGGDGNSNLIVLFSGNPS